MSGRSASEEKMIWEKCLGGAVRLLYVTPEKVVQSKWFLEMMQKLDAFKGIFKRKIIEDANCQILTKLFYVLIEGRKTI